MHCHTMRWYRTAKLVYALMGLCLLSVSAAVSADTANNQNSVKVTLTPESGGDPAKLVLSMDEEPIEVIDFPEGKKFIQFAFPPEYSDYSIRVFEMNETEDKMKILALYNESQEKGVAAFDAQWNGKASSQQKGHEFNLRQPKNHNMVLQNLNRDGTEEGTLHDYILKFTVEGKTYLTDPQIRNIGR